MAEKSDLVLFPSQYAYTQDVTKGTIRTYVGPTVVNPTAQERPVVFDPQKKSFQQVGHPDQSVQKSVIVPEGYYAILKNPAHDSKFPPPAGVHNAPDLKIGEKVNLTGPTDFAMWPGQMAKLIEGHHLKFNQFLIIRVYNEEEARKNWDKAVMRPAGADASAVKKLGMPADLSMGKLHIIRGTEVSFYIPPTGLVVLQDPETGSYTRNALTLEQLEYTILVSQSGKKRYEHGPQVVFPEPTESFLTAKDGAKKHRAIELNEIQGLHIKVIAPYTDEDGKHYEEGQEIFLTGKDTAIYFPREEHSIVRYDGKDKHFATAIPAGEGRYVMNRKSGIIETVRGPAMLLPNPSDSVICRRVLTDKECETWYPGNMEALEYNRALLEVQAKSPTTRAGVVSDGDLRRAVTNKGGLGGMTRSLVSNDVNAVAGDVFDRGSTYTQPRTVTLNTKYEGVPGINVHTGYAVLVRDKSDKRRVETGPVNLLLDFDEVLDVLRLSTGKPKNTDRIYETVYLRVRNNIVSDIIEVETLDHVKIQMKYGLVVNFEGETQDEKLRWFSIENYVKFLCDHVRSVLKGAIQKMTVQAFYSNSTDVIRDIILGKNTDGARAGMKFEENGMRVVDVDVLAVVIADQTIAALLAQTQQEAVKFGIETLQIQRNLEMSKIRENAKQEVVSVEANTASVIAQFKIAGLVRDAELNLKSLELEVEKAKSSLEVFEAKNRVAQAEFMSRMDRVKAENEQDLDHQGNLWELERQKLVAETEAITRKFEAAKAGFGEVILALRDQETLVKVAQAFSVQTLVGGESFVEVAQKVLGDTKLGAVIDGVSKRLIGTTPTARA